MCEKKLQLKVTECHDWYFTDLHSQFYGTNTYGRPGQVNNLVPHIILKTFSAQGRAGDIFYQIF
jgi:hypothetical protein